MLLVRLVQTRPSLSPVTKGAAGVRRWHGACVFGLFVVSCISSQLQDQKPSVPKRKKESLVGCRSLARSPKLSGLFGDLSVDKFSGFIAVICFQIGLQQTRCITSETGSLGLTYHTGHSPSRFRWRFCRWIMIDVGEWDHLWTLCVVAARRNRRWTN